jgi:hypothetical protein
LLNEAVLDKKEKCHGKKMENLGPGRWLVRFRLMARRDWIERAFCSATRKPNADASPCIASIEAIITFQQSRYDVIYV